MVEEATPHNLICSTFEEVVQCVVGSRCGEELGPFSLPALAAGGAVFSAPHWFGEHISQM